LHDNEQFNTPSEFVYVNNNVDYAGKVGLFWCYKITLRSRDLTTNQIYLDCPLANVCVTTILHLRWLSLLKIKLCLIINFYIFY
jgi:hypothetical protein